MEFKIFGRIGFCLPFRLAVAAKSPRRRIEFFAGTMIRFSG